MIFEIFLAFIAPNPYLDGQTFEEKVPDWDDVVTY
jgi:hypothetical protein